MITKGAVEATLKTIENPPEKWLDPNKGVLTRLLGENYELRKYVLLNQNEVPILEYASSDSYSLITSERIISERFGIYNEMNHINILNASKWVRKKGIIDPDEVEPLRIIEVQDVGGGKLLIEFDAHYPAYFAMILIKNFAYKLRTGKWFLNPGGKL